MSDKKFPSGVAIVTGGAGGMGSATAREFVYEGWRELLLCDIDADRLESVAAPLREVGANVDILAGDIADPAWPRHLLDRLSDRPIAAVVHTAGLSPQMAEAKRILAVNLDASVRLVDAIRDHMAPGAAAVLFASNSAHMPMPPEASAAFWGPLSEGGALALAHYASTPALAYPLSKIGVRALVKREAKSFGERGARLVSISPGAIDTAMTRLEANATQIIARMAASSPLGRQGRAEEVAAVAVFLCSPKASFVSGVDWLVDGGQTTGMGF
jgi:NAD(P)-dependent dehydrogenase (short-subunit alcohol dehydrogenase family)